MELLEVQGCLEGSAESPLVDTQSHFLPVRQRAQDLNGRNTGVEMTTHRRESVQVIERQRLGSVGKISHFFEALHEGRVSSADDIDGGNTMQEQQTGSCSPDVVGSELVTAAHQSGGQDIPCDDPAVHSSEKGLPEPVLALENGVEPSITCNDSILGDDSHSTIDTDYSAEDNSNCSQGESSLKLTSAATSSSQPPSAGLATSSDCDSHHPTSLSQDQVEDHVQVVMRDSPPPAQDHPADASQPKAEGVDMKELPSSHCTGDMHTTTTQEVEDGFHGDTGTECHRSRTEDLHGSVSVAKPPQLSIETLIPATPIPECTVVGVLSNEDQAAYPPECVTDVPDTHSGSSVVSAADHDKEEQELSAAAQSSDNTTSDELLHQLFTLPSNAKESDIEPSASKEDGMQVNVPDDDDQEVISNQTSGIHEQGGEVKPDISEITETMTVNSVQTDDTQIAAHKTNDVLSDEVECDAISSTAMIAVQREKMETSDAVMNDQQLDGSSTESAVTVQVREPEIAGLSIASAHSMAEVTEEALLVYETTSVVGLPQKHRESRCVMYIEFYNVPPIAEASISVTSEQVCENATVDTASATDCATNSQAVGQPPLLSDTIQSNLSLSVSQVGIPPVTWCSEQSQVTHVSTKTPPACTNAHSPPFPSGTPLPPVQITRENAAKDEHLVKEDSINGTAPLNMNDCDRQGVKTEPKTAVEQTMHEAVLDRPCTAPDLKERRADVENTQFVSHDYYTHALTAESAPDSLVQAVSETPTTVSGQHLQQSPVIGQSTLPSPGPAVVSGPPPDDFPALNPSGPPTSLPSSYSSDYTCLYNGDSQRWAQSGMWPGRQHNDRRQDHYLLQGHSYLMQRPCPPLSYFPTVRNQGFSSLHYGHSGKRLPPHPHFQQHDRRHAQHGTAFGPSHHFEPPQRTIPAPFAAEWTRSDCPEWGALQYGRDAHLYSGQVQRPVLQPPSFSGSGGASPVLLNADCGQVEDGVGQYYRRALPLYEQGKQGWGGSGGGNSKSSSSQGIEWYTSSSDGEPTQAPTTGRASQLRLHGDSTSEASLVDITQPCHPVWADSGGLAADGSRFESQASTDSVEVQTGQSTFAPSASPGVRYSDSLQMSSSTLNDDICQEGKVQWLAEDAGSFPSVDAAGSGMAPADPSLQECAGDTESAWRFREEYFQRRSECAEVALQLETSVWDENGEETGMLLSLSPTTANQTMLSPAKVTPRRPTRHKSAAASDWQQINRQGLYDTDSTSRLPLFHTPRGRGTISWTKMLFILFFVFVIVFMGLQLFVGHVGWLPSL